MEVPSILWGFVMILMWIIAVKRRVSSSLANYDIKYLLAWYRTRLKTSGTLLSRIPRERSS